MIAPDEVIERIDLAPKTEAGHDVPGVITRFHDPATDGVNKRFLAGCDDLQTIAGCLDSSHRERPAGEGGSWRGIEEKLYRYLPLAA